MVSGLPCAARAGQRFEPMGEAPVAPQAGEVMLVCGTRPLEVLRQAGLASKNRAITSLRETPLRPKAEGGFYLVGYDPAIVHSEPDKKQIIDWDVRPAVRLLTTGSLAPEVRAYRWVGGFSELIGAINCTEGPVDVAIDTETMGLHPWYPDRHIVSIGFTCQAGRAHCLYLGPCDDPGPYGLPAGACAAAERCVRAVPISWPTPAGEASGESARRPDTSIGCRLNHARVFSPDSRLAAAGLDREVRGREPSSCGKRDGGPGSTISARQRGLRHRPGRVRSIG